MSEIADQRRAADASEAPAPARGRAFNPLDWPISTRTPLRYGVLTAWLGHVPFGMAFMAMARPRRLVELGTHWGVSYCGFCQAVKELRLPTECTAVDTWEGDPHAGSIPARCSTT